MKNDFYYPSKDGKTQIHATEWVPVGEPRGILQICHGMVEYIGRYGAFADFMAGQGFYVVGNDHLGHGKSVINDEQLGYFAEQEGNECLIADIHALRGMTQERFPQTPYYMLGHSMGSFLLRQYIELYGEGLKGAIIMGTGSQPQAVLTTAKSICRVLAAFRGWTHRSTFVNNLALGSYNKSFQPSRTSSDWLTKDEQVVDAYLADPWCTFVFTLNAYYHMFRGIEFLQKEENIAKVPKDLPLLLVSGGKDAVGGFGKGVEQAWQAYQKAGIRDLSMKLYPEDRHEILNELDKEQVYADLLGWLEKH